MASGVARHWAAAAVASEVGGAARTAAAAHLVDKEEADGPHRLHNPPSHRQLKSLAVPSRWHLGMEGSVDPASVKEHICY